MGKVVGFEDEVEVADWVAGCCLKSISDCHDRSTGATPTDQGRHHAALMGCTNEIHVPTM